jgi:hypothetical protein
MRRKHRKTYDKVCRECHQFFVANGNKTLVCYECRKPYPCKCGCGKLVTRWSTTGYANGCFFHSKPKTRRPVCILCGETFFAADAKAHVCSLCKKPRACKCGCGKIVTTATKLYARGCATRGKSYLEIYGTTSPKCGFGKGKKNPMNNPVSVKKMLSRVSKRDIPYNDLLFRTTYELETYKKLERLKKPVIYEPMVRLNSSKICIPDFVLYKKGKIKEIYEVSGYASFDEKGRQRNKKKLELLHKAFPSVKLYFIVDKTFFKWYLSHVICATILRYQDFIRN